MNKINGSRQRRSFKAGDVILGVALTLMSLIPLFSADLFGRVRGKEALIYRNDKLEYTLLLDKQAEVELGNMKIEVADGRIHVLDSDCPGKICVHAGWIYKGHEKIICVPNRVLIEIADTGSSNEPDAVSY